MMAILGAKNPHPQTFLVGGMSIPVDPNSQNALNAGSIVAFQRYAKQSLDFVEKVYIPDILAVASFYKESNCSIGWALFFIIFEVYCIAAMKTLMQYL